ncbi:hypothetical protein [Methylomagnum sp.]
MQKPAFNPDQLFEHILTHYRGIFAVIVLLPISSIYTTYVAIRNRIAFWLKSAPAKHELRVQNVIRQIESWKADASREALHRPLRLASHERNGAEI